MIDPFVGSGNVLYHLVREAKPERGIGIDQNREVLAAARSNFDRLRRLDRLGGTAIELREGDWSRVVDLACEGATLLVVMPPWGTAYTQEHGLDLRETTPPVLQILEKARAVGGGGPLFALVQTDPRVVVDSLEEILARYPALETVKSDDPRIAARLNYALVQLR